MMPSGSAYQPSKTGLPAVFLSSSARVEATSSYSRILFRDDGTSAVEESLAVVVRGRFPNERAESLSMGQLAHDTVGFHDLFSQLDNHERQLRVSFLRSSKFSFQPAGGPCHRV